jgi:monofunctional biosynthetic peptidoglycan transglycosylase
LLLQIWFVVHIGYWGSRNPETTAFMRARLQIMREDDPGAHLVHHGCLTRVSPRA